MSEVYQAARERVAWLDRSDRGRIVVSGSDRASYLQGLFTNDIVALQPGTGCYTAYLTAQGRMIADAWVYELGDVILLSVVGAVKDTVLARLDQFIFTEDVQLGDVTPTFGQLALVGPRAPAIVARLTGRDEAALTAMDEHGNFRATVDGEPAIVTRTTDVGSAGFDVYGERRVVAAVRERLVRDGVPDIDPDTASVLRIEAGVPLFGRDMDAETIPLEAGIEGRAISLTKGCYVGQEVIIRVLHRGHGRVARKLVGLAIAGDQVPPEGAVIHGGDRDVGRVTSAARSPASGRAIALGYVRRDEAAPGTRLSIDGTPVSVVELPFAS
jgi:tRNA-modifying protein YgfZ